MQKKKKYLIVGKNVIKSVEVTLQGMRRLIGSCCGLQLQSLKKVKRFFYSESCETKKESKAEKITFNTKKEENTFEPTQNQLSR